MYKVMHWIKSKVSENGFTKVEHYFKDSEKALKCYFSTSKLHDNIALVISTEHAEFAFMFHYSDNFPKEIRAETFTEIFAEYDAYDLYEKSCGYTRRMFKFNIDGSAEEI